MNIAGVSDVVRQVIESSGPQMQFEDQYKKEYYDNFAANFDDHNIKSHDEHYFALAALEGITDFLGVESLLDVGSGTGRALLFFKNRKPKLKTWGVEPSDGMRLRAIEKGISPEQLIAGVGTKLPFEDEQIDLVTSFGVLHHIRESDQAVTEMLRVAKKAVFISDSNNMGQGPRASRWLKRGLTSLGLWPAAYWLRTGGKGYWTSPHDGLAYSFSLLNHRKQIEKSCEDVHYISTRHAGPNLVTGAGFIAILGIKPGVIDPRSR